MKNKKSILIGGLLVALLVIGVIGATSVYAQGPTTTPTTPLPNGVIPGDRHGRGLSQPELEAAAKALNMTTDELSTALQSGQTLDQVAQAANVDVQTVKDAIQAAHSAEMRSRIQQAVTDGTITQANADWLLEGLDKGYIGVPGAFDFGFGHGGPHGPGGPGFGHGNNNQTPPTQQQPTQPQPTQQSSG
jgi:uncharacterized membrane protein